MVQKRCIGALSQEVYIEDEEAAVHRYLNIKYSEANEDKKVLPEPLIIKGVTKHDSKNKKQ